MPPPPPEPQAREVVVEERKEEPAKEEDNEEPAAGEEEGLIPVHVEIISVLAVCPMSERLYYWRLYYQTPGRGM